MSKCSDNIANNCFRPPPRDTFKVSMQLFSCLSKLESIISNVALMIVISVNGLRPEMQLVLKFKFEVEFRLEAK